jgi:small conductance mechanosensitive channel
MNLDTYVPLIIDYGIKVVGVFVFLLLAWIVAGGLARFLRKRLGQRNFDATLTKFFIGLLKWGILILAAIACLGVFGIQTASFAAVLAAVGLAIGLAFQGTLSNFAAGVMLLVFRPFKVGDTIRVAGETGTVDEIELFVTKLDTLGNVRVIVPNSEVFGSVIKNLSYNPVRRVDINVGTPYDVDLKRVRDVLERVASSVAGQPEGTTPQVFLSELGDSSINWQVRTWSTPADYWTIWQATTDATKKALDEAGINIPFPQMDVHLDK